MRLLVDEDFNNDVLRVQDIPEIEGSHDPDVLEWAANHGRILFTHDVKTMTGHAADRIRTGKLMPGVFVVHQSLPIGPVIEDMLLIVELSREGEWEGLIIHLPLK